MEKVAEQGQAIAAAVEGVEQQLGADIPGTRKDMHHIFHTVAPKNKPVRFGPFHQGPLFPGTGTLWTVPISYQSCTILLLALLYQVTSTGY